MSSGKGVRILVERLSEQGPWVTVLWAVDHAVRIVTGAPLRRVSQITPTLHIGGQYRRRGWRRLPARGITAVVNGRDEFDDQAAGIAPPRYLYLPTPDDGAPSFENLQAAAHFIAEEEAQGGAVFVHCGAGVGRAPALVAAYLIRTGLSAEEAWARIRAVRPFIRPTLAQREQIERFADESRSGHLDKM